MEVNASGKKQKLHVAVKGSRTRSAAFLTEVRPLLSKLGCNRAQCHGAVRGKGGLRLSLFGGDAEADFEAFTKAGGGRRINRAEPRESLLYLKSTGALEHAGPRPVRASPKSCSRGSSRRGVEQQGECSDHGSQGLSDERPAEGRDPATARHRHVLRRPGARRHRRCRVSHAQPEDCECDRRLVKRGRRGRCGDRGDLPAQGAVLRSHPAGRTEGFPRAGGRQSHRRAG